MQAEVVVTVHGIRTFGQWQERLAALIAAENPNIIVENYHYGFFSVLAFLVPPLRWLAVWRFRRHVDEIRQKYPEASFSFVGHSFGTHLIGWGLYNMAADQRPKTNCVILAGSVLRVGFPWGELIRTQRVKRVINDCGIADGILLLSQFFVLFTGMAGRLGFTGMTGRQFVNRYHHGGHSHYFQDASGPTDEFMRKFWMPILVHNHEPIPCDMRVSKGPLQGVILWLMQFADALKLGVYGSLAWLIYQQAYAIPRFEARIAGERVQVEWVERTILLARSLLDAGDITRAVATFGDVYGRTAGQQRENVATALRYWLPRLAHLNDALKAVETPSVFRWGVTNYIKSDTQIAAWKESDVIYFLVSRDGKRLVLLDANNDVHSLQWPGLERVNSYSLGSRTGRRIRAITKTDQKEEAAEEIREDQENEENEENQGAIAEEPTTEQAATSSDKVEEYTDELVEPLDVAGMVELEPGGLIALFGYTHSTYAGGVRPKVILVDINSGQQAAFGFTDLADKPQACDRFEVFGPGYDSRYSLRLRFDEAGKIERQLVASGDRPPAAGGISEVLEACDALNPARQVPGEGLDDKDDALLAEADDAPSTEAEGRPVGLLFPDLKPERSLWSRVARDGSAVSSGYDETSARRFGGRPDITPIEKLGRQPIFVEADLVGFTPIQRYSLAANFQYPLDAYRFETGQGTKMVLVETSQGSKYGAWLFCGLDSVGKPSRCQSITFHGNYGTVAVSPDRRLIAVGSLKMLGSDSLYVFDLESFGPVQLPETPRGAVIDIAISNDAKTLSVISESGQLWIYTNLGAANPGLVRFNFEPGKTIVGVWDSPEHMATIAEDPLVLLGGRALARIDRFSGAPKWISSPMRFRHGAALRAATDDADRLIAVQSGLEVALLHAETGIWLSEPVDLAELYDSKEKARVDEFLSLSVVAGEVVLTTETSTLKRRPPLSMTELESAVWQLSHYTGLSSTAEHMPLPELPALPDPATNRSAGQSPVRQPFGAGTISLR